MALATTYRRRLHERALEAYGYVTTDDATELGIPQSAMRQIAERGGLTRVAHGVYRFDDVPTSNRDAYMEAVLAVGGGAHLVGDAVLALHDLGLVNPRRIRVGTSRRTRRSLPDTIEVVPTKDRAEDITVYEGIPTTSIARAILDCRGVIMGERLIDATNEAAQRGLLRRQEAREVLTALGART
jgi:predicted transcriptional regulator of viral defense system